MTKKSKQKSREQVPLTNADSYLPILFVCGHIRSASPAGELAGNFLMQLICGLKRMLTPITFCLQLLTN
jgi:hypothetical protein